MSLVGLKKELDARGWDCVVMNLNENRRVRSSKYLSIKNGRDYLWKLLRCVRNGFAVHVRVNGQTIKGYIIAFLALTVARLWNRPALLTFGGGHQQTYLPAPRWSLRYVAFSLLFRLPARIYCNNTAVKEVLLTTRIPTERVLPIPHTSPYYLEFLPLPLPEDVAKFHERHEGVFFSYVWFRKEFVLEFFAEAIRRFRTIYPRVGFLWVGPWERELPQMRAFLRRQKIEEVVLLRGSVQHEMFLSMLDRSLAYIRTPVTDGVCSSVLESLKLKVPVLAANNGTRPIGTELWKAGDLESLLHLMIEVVRQRHTMVERIPEIFLEDNTKKLADDIEKICLRLYP